MVERRPPLPRPERDVPPSSAEVASDYIRTLVFTGVLRSGDKVPIEEIADVLGISRQPVREALIQLAHDGLVGTDGRKGTFVADFGPVTIRDHYELYGLLQSYAVRRVTADGDPEVLDALRAIESAGRKTVDVAELTRLSIDFARVINRSAGNARLRQVMRAMTRFTPGEYYLANVPDALKRNRAVMRAQLRAIEAGDPEAAAAIAVANWAATGEELIAHLRSTGVFEDEPVMRSASRTTTSRSASRTTTSRTTTNRRT